MAISVKTFPIYVTGGSDEYKRNYDEIFRKKKPKPNTKKKGLALAELLIAVALVTLLTAAAVGLVKFAASMVLNDPAKNDLPARTYECGCKR